MNPYAIVMCGIPAAGKSTVRSSLLKLLHPMEFDIIAPDDMIDTVADAAGAFYRDIYSDIEARRVCYEAAWYRLERSIRAQRNVLIDRTHLSEAQRTKVLRGGEDHTGSNKGGPPLPSLLPLYRTIAVSIDLPTSIPEWIERLDKRVGKTIPPHTLFDMVRSFTPPTTAEGFEAVFTGAVDSDIADRVAAYIRENSL